jgi:hypothetical protein
VEQEDGFYAGQAEGAKKREEVTMKEFRFKLFS